MSKSKIKYKKFGNGVNVVLKSIKLAKHQINYKNIKNLIQHYTIWKIEKKMKINLDSLESL